MAIADANLALESAVVLECGSEPERRAWRNQRFFILVLGGIILTASAVWNRVMEPAAGMGIFVVIQGLGALSGGAVVVYQFIRLLRGFPRSATAPEATLRQFVAHALAGGTSWNAYVCLLDQAKKAAGSQRDFDQYWQRVRQAMEQDARRAYASELIAHQMVPTVFLDEVTEQSSGTHAARYAASIKVHVHKRSYGGGPQLMQFLGTLVYHEDFTLARVGDRWYLTSPMWTGEREGIPSLAEAAAEPSAAVAQAAEIRHHSAAPAADPRRRQRLAGIVLAVLAAAGNALIWRTAVVMRNPQPLSAGILAAVLVVGVGLILHPTLPGALVQSPGDFKDRLIRLPAAWIVIPLLAVAAGFAGGWFIAHWR